MVLVEIIETGESLGFVFPDEVVQRPGVKEGDEVCLIKQENSYLLESAE